MKGWRVVGLLVCSVLPVFVASIALGASAIEEMAFAQGMKARLEGGWVLYKPDSIEEALAFVEGRGVVNRTEKLIRAAWTDGSCDDVAKELEGVRATIWKYLSSEPEVAKGVISCITRGVHEGNRRCQSAD